MANRESGRSKAGTIEFDDRGNGRWVAHEPANTEQTVIRMLDVDWIELAPEAEVEIYRIGYGEVFRSGE